MSEFYLCPRCAADPKPSDFGSPRNCAFLEDGLFSPYNWNCATIEALTEQDHYQTTLYGDDETMLAIRKKEHGGWIVLTRYKSRGKVSSAIHVGDFYPPRPVTLELVEQFIKSRSV